MFHLIKNITVFPDVLGYHGDDFSIVMSKWGDYEWNLSKDQISQRCYTSCQFDGFDSAIKTFGSFVDFVQHLIDQSEAYVRIYADKESYAKLYINWLTMLFNVDKDVCYTLYCLSIQNFYINQIVNNVWSDDQTFVDTNVLLQQFKPIEQHLFDKLYNNYKTIQTDRTSGIKKTIANIISNHWKVAAYLAGSVDFKQRADEHLTKLIVRAYSEAVEMYAQSLLHHYAVSYPSQALYDVDDEGIKAVLCGVRPRINNDDISCYEPLYEFIQKDEGMLEYLEIKKLHDSVKLPVDDKLRMLEHQQKTRLIDFIDDCTVSVDRFDIQILSWLLNNIDNKSTLSMFKY